MSSNEEIAAAAIRLSESGIREKLEWASKNYGRGTHRTLPILLPYIKDILVMAEAGKLVAESLSNQQRVVYENHSPGGLPAELCQRFSELPQYAEASERVKQIVRGLDYADVIGIFLAGKYKKFIFCASETSPKEKQEFPDWVDSVLKELEISCDDSRIADFQQFADLARLLRHTPAHETFSWLNQSPSYLNEEALLSSDCERLIQMKIRRTSDLAQTPVQVLEAAFSDDARALQRLSDFLTKRNLSFGMKFLPQFAPKKKSH